MLAGGGALIVSFSLSRRLRAGAGARRRSYRAEAARQPENAPYLDAWIRIDADGSITVFTGKAELGQGFKTAFQQIAAEELDVAFETLKLVTADTELTANEGYTAGSHSMQDSGTAIQQCGGAGARTADRRSGPRLDLPAEQLRPETAR